jgi:hypothetical protein
MKKKRSPVLKMRAYCGMTAHVPPRKGFKKKGQATWTWMVNHKRMVACMSVVDPNFGRGGGFYEPVWRGYVRGAGVSVVAGVHRGRKGQVMLVEPRRLYVRLWVPNSDENGETVLVNRDSVRAYMF